MCCTIIHISLPNPAPHPPTRSSTAGHEKLRLLRKSRLELDLVPSEGLWSNPWSICGVSVDTSVGWKMMPGDTRSSSKAFKIHWVLASAAGANSVAHERARACNRFGTLGRRTRRIVCAHHRADAVPTPQSFHPQRKPTTGTAAQFLSCGSCFAQVKRATLAACCQVFLTINASVFQSGSDW